MFSTLRGPKANKGYSQANTAGKTMAKKKRKPHNPSAPTQWDMGTGTRAATHLTVIEEAAEINPKTGKKHNPNGVKRRRRISWVEHYGRKGHLTREQVNAGLRLQEAFERTQRRPPALKKVQVDSSPKPDANIAIQCDRMDKYHRIARHIPTRYRPFIDHVVIHNRPIRAMKGCYNGRQEGRYLERLAEGLQYLADRL